MVIVHRRAFRISRYGSRQDQGDAEFLSGPILDVGVRFQTWMDERPLPAEAFLDPGADATIFSLRWMAEHSGPRIRHPVIDEWGRINDESMSVQLGPLVLKIPRSRGGPLTGRQGRHPPPGWEKSTVWHSARMMPGCEDILLGRDFLRAHGLLLMLDSKESSFSLLYPGDVDNLRRHDLVVSAFDPRNPIPDSD